MSRLLEGCGGGKTCYAMDVGYVLEVLRCIMIEDARKTNGKLQAGLYHVGYMDAHFKTAADASSYYNRHNRHMRPLQATGTNASDWDPKTQLAYIVRKNYPMLSAQVPPFNPDDASVKTLDEHGCVVAVDAAWKH
jgi:hypothetical protein